MGTIYPKNLAISLNLESSEVLELFQWTKDNEINKNKVENLKDELADVYYWLLLLADHYNIDIENALEEKIKKNEKNIPQKNQREALKSIQNLTNVCSQILSIQ